MNSYGRLCTQYYDIDKPQPQADALAFYLDQAALSGGPLLEPMCGSGRFLLPLMQAGYDITGVDASPEMLAACRRKALRLGLTPDLHQQFLHELDLPCAYALVLIPSGSFGLITDLSQARESLRRLFRHTLPGGQVVLECDQMMTQPEANPEPGVSHVIRPDGAEIRLASSGTLDADEHIYHSINRYQLWVEDRVIDQEVEQFDLRYYEPERISGLLEEAGFAVLEVQAAFDDQKPLAEADSFIATARKP